MFMFWPPVLFMNPSSPSSLSAERIRQAGIHQQNCVVQEGNEEDLAIRTEDLKRMFFEKNDLEYVESKRLGIIALAPSKLGRLGSH